MACAEIQVAGLLSRPKHGGHRPVPELAAGRRRRSRDHPGRGQHAAGAGQALSEILGCEVWLKLEGANPTGSFKDRGMTVALSVAAGPAPRRSSARPPATPRPRLPRTPPGPVCCRSWCCPPAGSPRASSRRPSCTARTWSRSTATSTHCLSWRGQLAEHYPVALVNSVNPVRLEGQKTAAFEIVDELGDAPDLHVLPVGNGGNIPAYWRGYSQYAAPASPAVRRGCGASRPPARRRSSSAIPSTDPETVATAIRIGNPASTDLAIAARDESGGLFEAVTDEQILAAQASSPPARESSSNRRRRPELPDCWPSTSAASSTGPADRRHGHRPRAEGHRHRAGQPEPAAGRGRAGRPASRSPAAVRTDRLRQDRCATPPAGSPRSRVEVPATSANLGPGFDCFGLALDWREQVELDVLDQGFQSRSRGRVPTRCRGTKPT